MVSKMSFVVFILVISGTIAAHYGNNSASPCKAVAEKFYPGEIKLICQDSDPALLYAALDQQSAAKGVYFRVYIYNSKLTTLRPKLLGNMVVSEVIITVDKLATVGPTTFTGQENSLNTITFDKTSLKDAPGAAFAAVPLLLELHMSGTFNYQVVTVDSFAHLKNPGTLNMVDLNSNRINSIEKGAFAILSNLQYLFLTNNNLKAILPNVFAAKGPQNMRTFILDENIFDKLPSATVALMPAGATLSFQNNPLITLTKSDLSVLTVKKHTVDFRHTKLNCSCDFKDFVASPKWKNTMWFATCAAPKSRNGIFFMELTPKNFSDCPK